MPSPLSKGFLPADAVDFAAVKRVLVVKLRHHGDVLLTSPVLTALKRQFPHLEVDALVYAETRSMLEGLEALSRLYVVDRGWRSRGLFKKIKSEWQLLRDLRVRRHDLLICLTEQWRCAWLARLLPVRHAVVGEYPRRRSWLWHRSFTHHYAQPFPRDKIESHLDSLRRLGCPVAPQDKRSTLPARPQAAARIAELLAQHNLQPGGYVVLHPTSRWMYKCWMPERYAAVMNRLCASGVPVAISTGPGAEERAFAADIMKHVTAPVIDLNAKLSLPEEGELIRQAGCFLGVDSVLMHMAAAAGTPLVALFGPTHQGIWAPKGPGASILSSTTRECLPCMEHGCGNSGYSECLEDVTVERVLGEVISRFHSRR